MHIAYLIKRSYFLFLLIFFSISFQGLAGEIADYNIELAIKKSKYLRDELIALAVKIAPNWECWGGATQLNISIPAGGYDVYIKSQNKNEWKNEWIYLYPQHRIPRIDGALTHKKIIVSRGQSISATSLFQTSYTSTLQQFDPGIYSLKILIDNKYSSNEITFTIVERHVLASVATEIKFDHRLSSHPYTFSIVCGEDDKDSLAQREIFLVGEENNTKEKWSDRVILFWSLGLADATQTPQLKMDKNETLHVLYAVSRGQNMHLQFPKTTQNLTWQIMYGQSATPISNILTEYVPGNEVNLKDQEDGSVKIERLDKNITINQQLKSAIYRRQ